MLETFERLESEVRGYIRAFPAVFTRAVGSELWDETGRRYIDFFAGAGALNYGHNHPELKESLVRYLAADGIVHALDMATEAKRGFLERLESVVLKPQGYRYKVQFCGPTGTNAVEAALKLARKVTGRTNVVFFTNAFHGMTLGSLAVTGNARKRSGASVPLDHATAVPFDGYLGEEYDSLALLERLLEDTSSGVDKPAAVICETIQAEGGVNVARLDWLHRLQDLCRACDVLSHRRRHSSGYRADRSFLLVHPGRFGTGSGRALQIAFRAGTPHGGGAPKTRNRSVDAGRAQRNVSWFQPRIRHRGQSPRALLARRRAFERSRAQRSDGGIAIGRSRETRRTTRCSGTRSRPHPRLSPSSWRGFGCVSSRVRPGFDHRDGRSRGRGAQGASALTIPDPLLVEGLDILERAFRTL